MSDNESTIIQLRLEGIKDALSRSRLSFLAITIISLMVILAIWNTYFSWDHVFAWQEGWPDGKTRKVIMEDLRANWPKSSKQKDVIAYVENKWPESEARAQIKHHLEQAWSTGATRETVMAAIEDRDEVIKFLQQKWVEQWIKNQQISAPLLGTSMSASDATFLASIALIVAMIWFYWSMRRENHSIFGLLNDSAAAPPHLKWLVFHGIAANLLFAYLSPTDRAYHSLRKIEPAWQFWVMRQLLHALSYLPASAIFFCGSVQLIYSFVESPFRANFPWQANITYIAVVSGVACAAIFVTVMAGYQINRFQRGIVDLMLEFRESIQEGGGDQPG